MPRLVLILALCAAPSVFAHPGISDHDLLHFLAHLVDHAWIAPGACLLIAIGLWFLRRRTH
jgi:hydrogenase/urease accessory protein HupE